jgi:hypothetical protein
VSLDKTPPTISGALNATPNSFGWFRVAVAAPFTCNDTLSGVASCSAPASFGQGANQTATGTATDVAGNSASTTVGPVNVDLTAPTITAAPDRAPDAGSAYSGPVTIHFTCTDALSGIAPGACPADVTVSNDGVTTVAGSTTDRAGNTATVSATITVNVQSVRAQKQQVLVDISNRLAVASWHDKLLLKVARDTLAASIDPALWGTGNFLQWHRGVRVFEYETLSVAALTAMKIDPFSQVPDSVLNGWITTFTNADRVLATTQINDAIARHGTASLISLSQSSLGAGDQLAASGYQVLALPLYTAAWWTAEQSLNRHPDGGMGPQWH